MKYYSLKDKSYKVSFYEAMLSGLAPNKGLFFPEWVPKFSETFFHDLKDQDLPTMALNVLKPYVGENINHELLEEITKSVFNFDIPLVEVELNIFALELFHGPTMAFKDVGAKFLANCIRHLNNNKKIRVLVATSGDTGSAVANGFLGVEGTEIIVLYPKGKVSELQQKQFTTLGKNIKPIAIKGTFDDCQKLVKQAFTDSSLTEMNLTSANSINIARWLPQSVYYYWAVSQLPNSIKSIKIAVPSGNLGNVTAGLLAKRSGLNIQQFIIASNRNDTVPNYIRTGKYSPKQTIHTIANAMDVGDPNNFPRLLELFNNDYHLIESNLKGISFTDEEIKEVINQCYRNKSYLLDPHGATGYMAIKSCINHDSSVGIFLETAHPGKFYSDVKEIINEDFGIPKTLAEFSKRSILTEELSAEYTHFKKYLETTYN